MAERSGSRRKVLFGVFEADLQSGELRKNGVRIHLQDQPFQVLSVLLERAGQVVSREEICREVWGQQTFVEFDCALNTAVKKIRIAIGDDAATPRYIETVPKRGYRFIASLQTDPTVSKEAVTDVVSERPLLEKPRRLSSRVWQAAGVFTMIVLAGLGLMRLGSRSTGVREARRIVLAVLPFENASGDATQEALCDGITQEVITQLGRSDPARFGVAARNKILWYRHSTKPASQIGKELGADFLMEGNLRRDGPHIRLTAELIRARDEVRMWGDEFDGLDNGGTLAVETDLAKAIAAKVQKEALLPVQ
jgi:TolB-like protein/DNA-binding winged helix-turn-helix (wHTH) protein